MHTIGKTALCLLLLCGLLLCHLPRGYAYLPQEVNSGDLISRIAAGKGKVVVLHFWATWCPACRKEIPALNELRRRYSKEELMILAVAMDEDPQSVQRYAKSREIAYSLVVGKSSVGLDFRVSGVPKTLIYNRSGKLTFQGFGYLSQDKLQETVARILAN
jgi:thiol-disulfide isomerase/thioredoxin